MVNVMAELGGAGVVTPDILQRTTRGLVRLLHALAMLPGCPPEPAQRTREMQVCGSVYAYNDGVFQPLKAIGDDVAKGESVGLIHHPETPLQAPDPVTSPYAGGCDPSHSGAGKR
ncbi:MAG: putative deacylase [Paracoccaceae bacterium]